MPEYDEFLDVFDCVGEVGAEVVAFRHLCHTAVVNDEKPHCGCSQDRSHNRKDISLFVIGGALGQDQGTTCNDRDRDVCRVSEAGTCHTVDGPCDQKRKDK